MQNSPDQIREPRVPGLKNNRPSLKRGKLTKKQKIIGSIFLFLLVTLLSYFFIFKKDKQNTPIKISEPTLRSSEQEKIYSPLTGLEVDQDQASRPLTSLIIENSVDARPQSGLNEAGVVYEAIAEGGITRFATVYQENLPSEIGPVRSLRPYYLDWLKPYKSSIGHVGGSQKALKQVRDGSWKDMDQFANANIYWRSKERSAPHNVYTSAERIDKFNQTKNYILEDFPKLPRKEDQKSATIGASTINLNISSKLYNSVFSYDPTQNNYLRSQGGKPHLDKSGSQIKAKTLVVIISPYSIVQEDGSRSAYKTIGSGEAVVFQDGLVTPATWTKADQKSQIKLTDSTGKDIKLNRGKTWYTFLSSRDKLTYQ